MSTATARKRTTVAVWEITLKCNLSCGHCGSRAGEARDSELSTAEAIDLVHQMRDSGIDEVAMIGGEAFLRADWLDIAREISRSGMLCTMTTGGYGISLETARRMKDAGFASVSVSVDGLASTHDRLRGRVGSHHFCFKTMEHFGAVGLPFGNNTQINRLSAPELPLLYEQLRDAGSQAWQLQLTVPMGRAADNAEILMQPHELLDLFPMLAYLMDRARSEGVVMLPGNNIGYYGPYERLFRGHGTDNPWAFWKGCEAGLACIGVEADGKIKGCPSLPSSTYTGGNIRDRSLRDILEHAPEIQINAGAGTSRATEHLWGFCKSCEYGSVCRAGCNWTAHVFFDRRGNNPYCHHRALSYAADGIRERLTLDRPAEGVPFDNGVFAIALESSDAPLSSVDPFRFDEHKIRWPAKWLDADPQLTARIAEARAKNIDSYRALFGRTVEKESA